MEVHVAEIEAREVAVNSSKARADVLSAVAAGAAAGTVMGSLIEPGLGSIVGSALGAAVGGVAALRQRAS